MRAAPFTPMDANMLSYVPPTPLATVAYLAFTAACAPTPAWRLPTNYTMAYYNQSVQDELDSLAQQVRFLSWH